MKLANGVPPFPLVVGQQNINKAYLEQQLRDLNMEGESSLLHCSSSSASGHSSCNHSPPDTPSLGTPTSTLMQQHCPGRGGGGAGGGESNKSISNGGGGVDQMPQQQTTYVPYPTATTFSRSVQFCPPSYHRHPPAAYYHPQAPNGEIMYHQFPSFVSVLYSSAPPPPQHQQHQQPPNCFNCGGVGHLGDGCKEQCIEDITQRKGYQLDYITPKTDTSTSSSSSDK